MQENQKSSLSWSQPAVPSAVPKAAAPVASPAPKSTSKVAAQTSHTGTYVGIFVGGLIVGALIGWALTGSHPSGTASTTATSTTSTSTTGSTTGTPQNTTTIIGSGTITVTSPQTAGFAVAVSNVQVSQPTWVVVYEDRAGSMGNALGAALFLPQSGNNVQSGTVQLLRATLPGQNYFAGEAVDDGDKVFSLDADKPARDAQGNVALTQFSAK